MSGESLWTPLRHQLPTTADIKSEPLPSWHPQDFANQTALVLTLFCIPKPFQGHFGVIQRNALASWGALGPNCEALVFGDEEGAGAAAEAAGAQHLPAIERNEFGTPLLDDVFRQAHTIARNDTLCYVNSDIIFLVDLLAAVAAVSARFERYLMVGRRWNLDLEEPVSFQDSRAWRLSFRAFIEGRGSLYDGFNLDYFIFPKPLFENIPSFAVGRPAWDNWMVYEARRRQIPVIDATDAILAVHQNHDYSHTSEGRAGGRLPSGEASRLSEIAICPGTITSASKMQHM